MDDVARVASLDTARLTKLRPSPLAPFEHPWPEGRSLRWMNKNAEPVGLENASKPQHDEVPGLVHAWPKGVRATASRLLLV